MNAKVLDLLLFAVLPYVALFVFFLVTITRYRTRPFTYSSLSSQFLRARGTARRRPCWRPADTPRCR